MRRPLKPFVTEYKQSNRKSSTQLVEPPALETDNPAPKLADGFFKDPDDSYEAALRAADALFSVKPASAKPADGPPGNGGLESQAAGPQSPSKEEAAPSSEAPRPEKNGGRILRVIDEEPLPQVVALEAERAPKRRGRKPGSKNKPKIASGETMSATSDVVLFPSAPALSGQSVAQIEALVAVPRNAKRAGWGRGRLRPGEDWKRRRLPRVCW